MPDSISTLSYAVRPRVVLRYLSQLVLMLALLCLVPLGVSLAFAEYDVSRRYLLVVVGLLAAAWPGLRLPPPSQIQLNEAMVVVGLLFLLTPLLMLYPLASGELPLEDLLFETVSAITTTGLSTLGSVEGHSQSFLFSRAWMQWYGGLGIAVLSVALLLGHHSAARRLAEPTESENIASTARTQSRQVLLAYLLLTLCGSLLLWLVLGDPFDALVHMLATVSTGGFSSHDSSLAALPAAGGWIITLFSFAGAVPLLLYYHAIAGRPMELLRDPEVRALAIAVSLIAVLLGISLHGHDGMAWDQALAQAAMLGTSAQTTTGFTALPVAELDASAKLILMIGMLIGGGSGSTAGGIKLLRLLILLQLLLYFLRRSAMPPHAVAEPRLSGRLVEPVDVERVTLVLGLFVAVIALSWLAFLAYGYPPLDALFEVVSATATVGLSTGISAPSLEPLLKLVLGIDMLLGRLEMFALLVLLYPRTWIGKRVH